MTSQVFIHRRGGKRKVSSGRDSSDLILSQTLNNKSSIPNLFKNWCTKRQYMSFLNNLNIIADVWAIKAFIHYINVAKDTLSPTTIYIEESERSLRFRGTDFPITEADSKWRATRIEGGYYCYVANEVVQNEIDKLVIPFDKGGIDLYSPNKIGEIKEEGTPEGKTLVKIDTNTLYLNDIDVEFFSNTESQDIVKVNTLLREAFSEIIV